MNNHVKTKEQLIEELDAINNRLGHLAQSAANITICAQPGQQAQRLLEEFARNMSAEGGSLYLYRDGCLVLAHALDPDHVPNVIDLPPRKGSVFERVLDERKPVLVRDFQHENELTPSGWAGYKYRSSIAFPLPDKTGQIAGILCLHNKTSPPFTPQDLQIGSVIASLACQVLQATQTETERHESEEHYRAVVDATSDFVWRMAVDGFLTFVSPAAEQMFGYEPKALLGKSFEIILTDDSARKARKTLEARVRGELGDDSTTLELVHRRRDGTEFVGEARTTPIHDLGGRLLEIVGVTRDITDRKHAQAVLLKKEAEAKEKLAQILEGMNLWVVIMNEEYGIEYINQSMADFLSSRNQEHCYELDGKCAPCETEGTTTRCAVREILRDGRAFVQYKHSAPLEEGGKHFAVWAYPIEFNGRRCVIEVHRDITELVQLEEQLRQAQKMEAVGQLAGGVAHDFNNLLQAILGYTHLAMCDLPPAQKRYQDLEQVKVAAERAATLTRQLLALSRRQVMQPESLDLNQIVTNLARMLGRVIGEHIELDLSLGDELDVVHADPTMVEQVLMNLCVNARDAMPSGGRLAIETGNVVLDERFCAIHTWAKPGDFVRVSVTDTGVGILPEFVERIFDPFFTTKEVGKGTGLGLATVYGIMKQHEGLIHCRSKPELGTTFAVYLPALQRLDESAEGEHDLTPIAVGTETVLLAEDEEQVRELAARVLRENGYTVLTAVNGEEALELFEANADSIDLAVLDAVMPKLGGRDVSDRIKQAKPETRILFSSGYNTATIEKGFVLEKGMQLIQKPFTPGAFLRRVREELDRNDGPGTR